MVETRSHTIMSGEHGIKVEVTAGQYPPVLWLGGFRSDMAGGKAAALSDWGYENDRSIVRFDYRGHGVSEGRFEDFVISDWLSDAKEIYDRFCAPGTVAVGSSMGGWIALLMAKYLRQEGEPLGGLVLIAPAPDFTDKLMWPSLTPEVRAALETDGRAELPSAYGDPTPITMRLFEDGRRMSIFDDAPIETGCPVHVLQGVRDPDVPHTHALEVVERLSSVDVVLTLIKDGDHRLSRKEDIERILSAVESMLD